MSAAGGVDGPPEPPQAADRWCGQLTVPRELGLGEEDALQAVPARELVGLRAGTTDAGRLDLAAGQVHRLADDLGAAEVELQVGSGEVTLTLGLVPGSPGTRIGCDAAAGTVTLTCPTVGGAVTRSVGGLATPVAGGPGEGLRLRVLVDRGSVEVFAGAQAISCTVFPPPGPRAIELGCSMAASVAWRLHPMASIWESPDR